MRKPREIDISYTPKGGTRQRWCGDSWADYLEPRLPDVKFRERLGLKKASGFTPAEIRRNVVPVARQDWVAFCERRGPDPRKSPALSGVGMTVNQLLDRWWHDEWELKPDKTSRDGVLTKVGVVRQHYGALPIGDLLRTHTHSAFIKHMLVDRQVKRGSLNIYLTGVILPMMRWASRTQLDGTDEYLLNGPLPHIDVDRKAERKMERKGRRVPLDIIEALWTGADALGATHLKLALTIILWAGSRPHETCLLRPEDIDYRAHTIRFRAETTKAAEERVVPYNPEGELAKALNAVRFTARKGWPLVAPAVLNLRSVDTSKTEFTRLELRRFAHGLWRRLVRDWPRLIIVANGGTPTKRLTKPGRKGAWVLDAKARKFYHGCDQRARDFRHEAISRMKEVRVEDECRHYLTAHKTPGAASRYEHTDLEPVVAELQDTYWPAENAGRWALKTSRRAKG